MCILVSGVFLKSVKFIKVDFTSSFLMVKALKPVIINSVVDSNDIEGFLLSLAHQYFSVDFVMRFSTVLS